MNFTPRLLYTWGLGAPSDVPFWIGHWLATQPIGKGGISLPCWVTNPVSPVVWRSDPCYITFEYTHVTVVHDCACLSFCSLSAGSNLLSTLQLTDFAVVTCDSSVCIRMQAELHAGSIILTLAARASAKHGGGGRGSDGSC
jgi:hypothetical protein